MTRVTIPACSAVARVVNNARLVYSWDFEGGNGGWTAPIGMQAATPWWSTRGKSGDPLASTGTFINSRVITGLTAGRTYTFLASAAYERGTAPTAKLGVDTIGASAAAAVLLQEWTQLEYTFVATAASHTLQLITIASAATLNWWDDIRVIEHESQIGADIALSLHSEQESSIAFDDTLAPFVQAKLAIALPDQADLDKLDTRSSTTSVRVVITAEQQLIDPAGPDQLRTFDLLLHERSAVYQDSTLVTLICHSDEAILIDAGNDTAAVDDSPFEVADSLRDIVSSFLQSRGMLLEPGTADADYTVTSDATNLILNPGIEVNANEWAVGTGTSAVARSNTVGGAGGSGWALRATASAASSTVVLTATSIPVVAGKFYRFSVYIRSQVARAGSVNLQWKDSGGGTVSTDTQAFAGLLTGDATTSATMFDRFSIWAQAPAGAVGVRPYVQTTGNTAGQFHYFDQAMLIETDTATFIDDYFDGDTPDDALYSYSWTGSAGGSTSVRTRLDDRDPQLLSFDPGEKDWDFLHTLVQAAGLRLFCDETRSWYLVDPDTYTVPGTLTLDDPKRAEDTISRERGQWADAVVVKYSWVDADGVSQVRYDVDSGGGSFLVLVERKRPWPGAGAAALIRSRRQAFGRVQVIEASPDLDATPAMAVTTQLPNTPAQEGSISKVEFTFRDSAIGMSVRPRDLADA